MAFLLRKIRKSKWYKNPGASWLVEGDLQSDALDDLQTKDNQLSVYYINDDESNLGRVLAAMAANCNMLSNIDFALFDQATVSEINIKMRKTEGNLPDHHVSINWHQDLYELSASKRMALAMSIHSRSKIRRISHKQILALVAEAITSGKISRERLKWQQSDLEIIDEMLSRPAPEHLNAPADVPPK